MYEIVMPALVTVMSIALFVGIWQMFFRPMLRRSFDECISLHRQDAYEQGYEDGFYAAVEDQMEGEPGHGS